MKKTSARKWIEVTAAGPWERKDEASFLLIEAGSTGVVEDTGDVKPVIKSHSIWEEWQESSPEEAPEPGTTATLKAYFNCGPQTGNDALRVRLSSIGWSFTEAPFIDRGWETKWKEGIRPVRIKAGGRDIIIRPSWCKVKREKGDIVIDMDPGLAFGTGSHATTRMCLKAIAAAAGGKRLGSMLDVGTGTGILAIAGRKLGIKSATGTDIDPMALKAARTNLKFNRVEARLTGMPLSKVSGRFPLVVANILSSALISLAPELVKKVEHDGTLILSGILEGEVEDVRRVYLEAGLRPLKRYSGGEWVALSFRKGRAEK